MWWWLSCGGGCHVVVIVMWWWFSCKIKHGNGDRCWLYRACWWLSCGGGCHVVLIVIGTGCHVVVEVIGNDCPGSGWLLTVWKMKYVSSFGRRCLAITHRNWEWHGRRNLKVGRRRARIEWVRDVVGPRRFYFSFNRSIKYSGDK